MTTYKCDGWQFILIKNTIKVFTCNRAGFAGTDSWRLNSGTVQIIKDDGYYYVYGHSGSVYELSEYDEGCLSFYGHSVLGNLKQQLEELQASYRLLTVDEAIQLLGEKNGN